ncbi:MAG: carbonic anhydrase [Candidatus Binatia bacterium]
MKTIALTLIALNALCIAGTARADADALRRLVDGNERFAAGRSTHPEQSPTRRAEVAAGQQPFAAVVGCADSRVPPEVVLDQGCRRLRGAHPAGNVVDDAGLGSLEFAVASLGARLIVVMGHESAAAARSTPRSRAPR